jgi:adenylosuccinate lyase
MAIRRIDIPEMFLLADAILILLNNVTSGLVVYPAVIQRRISDELPLMATENFIMEMVAKGGDRQEAYKHIRVLSHQAAAIVKQEGKPNELIEIIRGDPFFAPIQNDLERLMDPSYFIGRTPQQVRNFLKAEVEPALLPFRKDLVNSPAAELHV